jgi:hypothetical protein
MHCNLWVTLKFSQCSCTEWTILIISKWVLAATKHTSHSTHSFHCLLHKCWFCCVQHLFTLDIICVKFNTFCVVIYSLRKFSHCLFSHGLSLVTFWPIRLQSDACVGINLSVLILSQIMISCSTVTKDGMIFRCQLKSFWIKFDSIVIVLLFEGFITLFFVARH